MIYASPSSSTVVPSLADEAKEHVENQLLPSIYEERMGHNSLEDSLDSANTSFSSNYSASSEECPTPVITLEDDRQPTRKLTGVSLESRKPLGDLRLNAIQSDPILPVSLTKFADPFDWSTNNPNRIPQSPLAPSSKKEPEQEPDNTPPGDKLRRVNRLRSGSESKAQSLQPLEIECINGQKVLTICPSLFTVNEATTQHSDNAKNLPNVFEWRPVQELNEENLRRLNERLEEGAPNIPKSTTCDGNNEGSEADSAEFLDDDEEEGDNDHLLIGGQSKSKKEGDHIKRQSKAKGDSANVSMVPTISTSPPSDHSPFVNDSTERAEEPQARKSISKPVPELEPSSPRLPSFFDPDVILPLPSNDTSVNTSAATTTKTQNPPTFKVSNFTISISRLATMLSKQRKVDFEYDEADSSMSSESLTVNKDISKEEKDGFGEEMSAADDPRKIAVGPKLGKVRCTLSKAERMLGIRWIQIVDTSSTTNPNITPEVRYHASILFSLYWGSRSGKSNPNRPDSNPEKDAKKGKSKDKAEGSEKEERKKQKLIATTAMASLTLATKWHFDFCKPLFTVQLRSFCQTTNYGSFRVTPENLIMAERAILFSYPVAGGLWLDCPHAFLEELIQIIPTLHALSSIPEYILRKNYYNVGQSLRYYDEQKNFKEIDNDGVWDWPDVMHEFDLALERVTTVQEFLAFNPTVFCVIALYLALVEVEPGYYEKNREIRKKKRGEENANEDLTNLDASIATSANIQEKLKKLMIEEDLSELWIWKFIDVNETMNQVCEALKVSAREVEECLNWYSNVEFDEIQSY